MQHVVGKRRSARPRSAFTLVELLVVIGIIGLLISILLPSLKRARERANQIKCASQLHQLGVAFAAYAADGKGWLPAWSGWHVYPPGSSPEDNAGISWTEQLAPYIGNPDARVYNCPSFTGPSTWINYFITSRWAASQRRTSTRFSEIRLSTQFVLGGENTDRHMYGSPFGDAFGHVTNDCDQDDANACCALFPPDDGGFLMHPGGNNLLFGDLHVQSYRAYDPTSMTFAVNAMRPWSQVVPPPLP